MTDKEIELQAKIDWLQIENENLEKKLERQEQITNDWIKLYDKYEAHRKRIVGENEHFKRKIAEALHQIHEGKTGNAIQILNHLAIL